MPKDLKLNGTVYSGVKGVKLPLEEDTTQFATFEETGSSGGGPVSWDDITDKPFGKEGATLYHSEDNYDESTGMYRFGDAPANIEDLCGAHVKYYVNDVLAEGKLYRSIIQLENVETVDIGDCVGSIVDFSIYYPNVYAILLIGMDVGALIAMTDAVVDGAEITAGIWTMKFDDDVTDATNGTVTVYSWLDQLSYERITKIPSEYLPASIGYDVIETKTYLDTTVAEVATSEGIPAEPVNASAKYRVSIDCGTKSVECMPLCAMLSEGYWWGFIGDNIGSNTPVYGFMCMAIYGPAYEAQYGHEAEMSMEVTDWNIFCNSFGLDPDYELTGTERLLIEEIVTISVPSPAKYTATASNTVMLLAASWEGDSYPYTQTVEVPGITKETMGVVGIADEATDEQYTVATEAQLRKTGQDTNSLTIKAYGTKPSVDIPITISGIWDK